MVLQMRVSLCSAKTVRNSNKKVGKTMVTRPDHVMTEQAAREARVRLRGQLIKAGVCPECDARILYRRQDGHCVYAVPCGHKLYHGKA
jgi:hypothetical protein